jgi:hypothetical protein
MGILDGFTALAAEVWRKYVTAGVPASGLHQPDLTEIERWGTDIEVALAALTFGETRIVTAAGDASFAETEEMLIINKTVGAASNVNIPDASTRVLDVMIKDGKGDADTNNITPVFTGGQTCDGLTGSSSPGNLKITTPRGMLWMRPLPDGTGYTLMPSQL